MATTKQLVDALRLSAPNWNRTGEKSLLSVLNQAQEILMYQEAFQNLAINTSTGKFPVLTTTDGVFYYDLTQANTGLNFDIWRVSQVLIPIESYQSTSYIEYGVSYRDPDPIRTVEYFGTQYYKYNKSNSFDAGVNGNPYARVIFQENPTTSTDKYFLLAFRKPISLDSESIALSLPTQLHYSTLLPTAIKLVEAYQNNNWDEAMAFIDEKYKPHLHNEMNMGEQSLTNTVKRYEE